MNTVEILTGARELLVTKGWTQGVFGRDDAGRPLNATTTDLREGVCFCGWGACFGVASSDRAAWEAAAALNKATPIPNGGCAAHFPSFNDTPGRTLDEVLAVFDTAINAETVH